jgi:Pectinesterase
MLCWLVVVTVGVGSQRASALAASGCNVPSTAYPTIGAAVVDPACATINVAAGTYTENVIIERNVTIRGDGQATTIVDGSSLVFPVFLINSGTVTIKGLTIRNGSFVEGGGILTRGTLTVQNSTLSGNSGPFAGGGIANGGTLTVQNSTVSGNSAGIDGGGIFNDGTVSLTRTTLVNNTPNDCSGCP